MDLEIAMVVVHNLADDAQAESVLALEGFLVLVFLSKRGLEGLDFCWGQALAVVGDANTYLIVKVLEGNLNPAALRIVADGVADEVA